MDYFPWEHDMSDENLGWLDDEDPAVLREDSWKWHTGKSIASWFPDDVTFKLSKDHGIQLPDSIPNTSSCLVVSEKLKAILASTGSPFEFFPVKIRNHKKKVVPNKYYFANLIGLLPATDKKRSDFELSAIDDRVMHFRRLVLDESKIPKETQIFRLAELRELYIANDDLATRIVTTEKCTGISFTYMEDYGMQWRGR